MDTPSGQRVILRGTSAAFTPEERRGVAGLTGLLTLRMLGFYLVLPVLTPYAQSLSGSTPLLVGLSVGIYGLSQTLFQIPFGALSDRWGRKPVLTLGLALFAAGSAVCAIADTTFLLVMGRLIQGMGAIASVLVAMVADLTRDRVRSRAMALVGISIGGSFAIGLLFGPTATEHVGIPVLFWFTTGLTLLGIVALWTLIPNPPRLSHHDDTEYSGEHLFEVVRNRHLLRLDWGVFNLHMSLTAIFVTMPFFLEQHLSPGAMWRVFLPAITIGLAVMLLGPRLAERRGGGKWVALLGQTVQVAALIILAISTPATPTHSQIGLTTLIAGLFLFIIAFALLEPLFPALLTRLCGQTNRGTAAGIFNMSQFSGAFVGGVVSGLFLERSLQALFWFLAGTGFMWLLAAFRLEDPDHLSVVELPVGKAGVEQRRKAVAALLRMGGVEDVAWERDAERIVVRFAEDQTHAGALIGEAARHLSPPQD